MMEKQTIATIKKMLAAEEISADFIETLKADERVGVQKLLKNYEKEQLRLQTLEKEYQAMCQYENKYYHTGHQYIAGVDEAGRGPLAGPVVAAAVILPQNFKLLGLNDSKQLSAKQRDTFFDLIKEQAISYHVSIINNLEIDKINIFEATKRAMYEAINQLQPAPEQVLIDAVQLSKLPCTSEVIVKGDSKSVSIAAASILAKVTRDRLMIDLHNEYPMYDFASNMGYGTKKHMEALKAYGPTPFHRRSFAPVQNAMS